MELNRGLLKAVIILLFVQFGLGRRMGLGLSSRTEWRTLLELRSSLGISGKDWVKKAEPCFHWTGVQCENGRVVGINLTGLSRTRAGRLQTRFAVDSLANLTLLGSFCASGFSLNGSIHEWLGQSLRKLEKLDLRSCWLTGPIPGSLGGLNGLKTLILSDNSLTGRMPSELGRLSGLSVLDLSNNSLTGPVPNSFSFLVNLTRLDLSSNFLSGSIPPHLGALSNLQILNLSDNGLTASVPPQLGNLYNLVKLDLSKNSLSGSLPDLLFSKIQMLILSENAFDGALPATLFSGPNLHFLDVSNNTLTGPLPKLTSSSNVNYAGATFNLSNNLFYGPLITMPSKFKTIDLSGNYFQGEVHVGRFKFSTSFTLDRNCLRMIPNQRDLEDCRVFYVERALPFSPGVKEPTQSPLLDSESGNNKREIFILAGIFGGLGFIVLLVLVLMLMLLLKQCSGHNSIGIQRGTANVGPVPEVENPTPPKDPVFVAGTGESFSYEQMLHLTANFAEENLIKHGHSGDLFWGTLEGGVTAVVKKVDLNLFKKESYMVELGLLLSKVSHARLVPLLGHCLENEHEKFLIYKYMPNGDFATSLHRVTCSDDKFKSMDWITRLKIAIGAAEGLSYLHECSPPLVHRDVQASSILLDDKFEVRLGSLSEVTAQGDLHQSVITRIFRKSSSLDQGNSGSSLDSCPYDVYCFGKVLLELITGNLGVSKSDDAATKEWLEQTLSYISIYDKEQVTRIVDPSLIVDDDLLEEVWAMAIVARSCLNPKPSKRPPMRYVLKALENPVKLVREENYSSARLRTTSSRRSWSFAFLGSWRQSSSESATATVHTNTEGASGFRQSGRVSSQGSGGNDHSFSQKISSNEIFPEPLEMQEMERQDEH
ncbi:probable LRR receptor-like serine/threonine-protein kinase At2g16250 [Gastrolobium bilobum]|uniref:probable LRR receptor-like serine/threonine-protein kinase At2g16250 n=1 Tax=Gastrolobium bilobum TaxID=150636 RepID=UPI002AB16CDE|nr:probable LRR receptor-like serine/threonine-protein kinase At2g16250 [Gastrolobium bilobum]